MTFLEEEGILLIRNLDIFLRKYGYQRPEFLIEVVHGSTLHFRTIIADGCNISHTRFLPRHFIFTHKENINVFKIFSVKCEEIWQFDIREFNIKTNQGFEKWIYVSYSQFCKYRNII
jgi:hypothetical protein